ncbi:pmpB, partial [Symbiodinium sp. CCMP2456]
CVPRGTASRSGGGPGYQGRGCTDCSLGYAMADSSVLSCTPCNDQPRVQAAQWMAFVIQRVILFAIAAVSINGARTAGELKQSSIYLNQLMAFSTVATTVITAVMQTNTAKDMKSAAVNYFFQATLQVAETSSGQGSLGSTRCLLSYVNRESLWNAHLLDLAVAVALMLALHSRAAVVAGLNCFVPAIAAGFGKYLVCYRLEPDNQGGLSGLQCPYLPGGPGPNLMGAAKVLGGLVVFLTAVLWTWLQLSRSTEEKPPAHVVFLTSKYRERFSLFETERLVRKTLITVIGAVLPVAASPALQMGSLGVVVATSLILYVICRPYHNQSWNWSEISLLFVANYMILIVSALLANEFHWAHSQRTQETIVITAALCAAVTSATMSYFVVAELLKERK